MQGQGLPSAGSQASRAPSCCTNGRRAREPRGSPWPSPTQTATMVCGAISSCFHTLSSLVAESQEGPRQTPDTRRTSAAGHNVKMRSVDAQVCTGLHAFARACTGLHRFAHICTAGRVKAPQLGLKGLRHSDRDCPQDTRWQSHAPRSLGTSSEAALGGGFSKSEGRAERHERSVREEFLGEFGENHNRAAASRASPRADDGGASVTRRGRSAPRHGGQLHCGSPVPTPRLGATGRNVPAPSRTSQ